MTQTARATDPTAPVRPLAGLEDASQPVFVTDPGPDGARPAASRPQSRMPRPPAPRPASAQDSGGFWQTPASVTSADAVTGGPDDTNETETDDEANLSDINPDPTADDDDDTDDPTETQSDETGAHKSGSAGAAASRKRRGRPSKSRGAAHSSDAASARWTVRGVPTNVRDMALRAADSRNMTVGDWLAEAIIARARHQPKVEEPKVPATAASAPPDLVSLIERMDERLARLEERSNRSLFNRLFGRQRDLREAA